MAFLLAAAVAVAPVARAADRAPGAAALAIELHVAGSLIHLTIDSSEYTVGTSAVVEWVRRSASIVSGYYGTFPVGTASIRVTAVEGGGVRNGRATADPAPRIDLRVGRSVTADELLHDWVLVHEMTHLALPEVGRAHAWLAEGLATYVEGVARVQSGNLDARDLWREDVASMPKGLPQAGDEGLDRTHTWGRTYWGGALFCLAADVTIRERSGNARGLQDALRAILQRSGGMVASWPVERVFATGDAATGTTVLSELYEAMREAPTVPDLAGLWRRLGISIDADVVRFDKEGRAAEVRASITRPFTAASPPAAGPPARP